MTGMTTHHALDYVEISVTDLARAREFYGQAFGWRFNDYGPDYAGIQARRRRRRGRWPRRRPRPPARAASSALLRSDDLDASVAAVESAGGSVVEAPYDYPGGRRFIFGDPDGNMLGVYQPSDS